MIRFLDVLLAVLGLLTTLPFWPILLLIGWWDTGSPVFLQKRVGRNKSEFTLIKLRTMQVGTLSVPTHEASSNAITSWGKFLRATKLDELPQLINVVTGAMSLVGPRPCLPSQTQLIEAREKRNVFSVRPGITGLAQVNNIDMSDPEKLARIDEKLIECLTILEYMRLIMLTVTGSGQGDKVNPQP